MLELTTAASPNRMSHITFGLTLQAITAASRVALMWGRAIAIAVVVMAILATCDSPRREVRAQGLADTTVAPRARVISVETPRELRETSAAVITAEQPGILFTINDSGHDPLLFAMDTTGTHRGTWRIEGARNQDWEAAASGPCGRSQTIEPASTSCLYVGDVGDNAAARRTRVIYRVHEPRLGEHIVHDTLAADRLEFRYEDRPHDVEAMYATRDAAIVLITKRRLLDTAGQPRPALVFRIPPEAWEHPDSLAVAQLIDSLPIVPGSAPGRLITDASLAHDGRWLAVRTYAQVYVFAVDSITGRVRQRILPSVCNVTHLDERQGEGIAWFNRGTELLLTSEGRNAPYHVISCPRPRDG